MGIISQNVDDKFSLNPITTGAEALIKKCPKCVMELYETELPKWEELLIQTIGASAWFRDQPKYKISSRDILYFWPLFLSFCWSFDQKFVTLNLLQLAYNMRPEAFIADAHFREQQGESPADILKDHWKGVVALWLSQVIKEFFNSVIGKNYIGQQVARFIFAGPDSNPMNLKKLTRNDSDLEAEINIEIIRELGKSERNAVKMTRDYFVRQVLRDKLQSIPSDFIDTFSAEGNQLKNAIDGHFRYVKAEARKEIKKLAAGKPCPILDSQADFDKPGSDKKFIANTAVSRDKALPYISDDVEGINEEIGKNRRLEYYNTKFQLEGEERRDRALGEARTELLLDAMGSQTTKDVMELLFENPDLTNAEIAEKLGITRMTVSKHKNIGLNDVKKIYRITP